MFTKVMMLVLLLCLTPQADIYSKLKSSKKRSSTRKDYLLHERAVFAKNGAATSRWRKRICPKCSGRGYFVEIKNRQRLTKVKVTCGYCRGTGFFGSTCR